MLENVLESNVDPRRLVEYWARREFRGNSGRSLQYVNKQSEEYKNTWSHVLRRYTFIMNIFI